ncbi:MAG: 1-acyl-sn-glycerol-3-phosphate acyltransferase, partial [Deltaproteobacteria bacterium]|nr:1-acyl-sn-glycerol-3-phosphate acyltransferase [Nannocystaceae bacterium]
SRASLLVWEAVADARTRVGGRTPQACAERLAWLAGELCEVHGIRIDQDGELPEGPVVLVANHVGYLDPMVLLSRIPALPIAKRELGDWPLVGRALAPLGVSLVRRGDPYDGARALRRAAVALEDGVGVLVYPEGTTTGGASVLPLRRGIFGVARRMGIPVVPVVLRYESRSAAWVGDEWFLPHYARTLATESLRVRLTIGSPITSRQDPQSFARFVQHRMIAMLDRSARPRLVHAA